MVVEDKFGLGFSKTNKQTSKQTNKKSNKSVLSNLRLTASEKFWTNFFRKNSLKREIGAERKGILNPRNL